MINTFTRKLKTVRGFSVLSWNVLADAYFEKEVFTKVEHISMENRAPIFQQMLNRYGADLVCLQQCDRPEYFVEFFDKSSYKTLHRVKNGSKQGLFLAINTTRFSIVHEHPQFFKNQRRQFWVLILKDNLTGKEVLVLHTHLKASDECEDMRLAEVEELQQTLTKFNKEHPKSPIIVLGDLNTQPTYKSFLNLFNTKLQNQQKLQSAYDLNQWTNCNTKDTITRLRTLDYILYKGLKPILIEQPPNTELVLSMNGIPQLQSPSDHLPLFCVFDYE